MKDFLTSRMTDVRNWWTEKTAGGKILSVAAILATVLLVYVGISFAGTYYADKKRREALSATDAEGRPLNSRVHNGKVYVPNPDVVTYMILGIDKKEDVDISDLKMYEFGQADAIFLVAVDTGRNTVKVISIPRDTMVNVKTYAPDGSVDTVDYDQLCLQYAYGKNLEHCAELMKKAIMEQVFKGVTIDHYAAVNYACLPVIVDDIGGLDITMSADYDITYYPWDGTEEYTVRYNGGETYHLTGTGATAIAQFRDISIDGSANDRLERQKDFLKALYHDGKEAVKKDPTLVAKIYGDIQKGLNSDLSITDILTLVPDLMEADFSVDNSVTILPGEIGEEIDYWDQLPHNTFELDKDGVKQVMMDTWYIPWEGQAK